MQAHKSNCSHDKNKYHKKKDGDYRTSYCHVPTPLVAKLHLSVNLMYAYSHVQK